MSVNATRAFWVQTSFLLLLTCLGLHTWYGPDIWYHLFLGTRVLVTHSVNPSDHLLRGPLGYVNFYWLFQLVCLGLFKVFHTTGVTLLFTVLWFGVFWFWNKQTHAAESALRGAIVALGTLFIFQLRFEQRPEVVSYFFMAIWTHELCAWSPDRLFETKQRMLLCLAQWVWCGMHGYFFFGPLLLALRLAVFYCFERPALVVNRARCASQNLAATLGLLIATTLVTPLSVSGWLGVARLAVFFAQSSRAVQEFRPPWDGFSGVHTIWAYWAYLALVLFLFVREILRFRVSSLFLLLLSLVGMGLSVTSFRNIPLLPIFSAPLLGLTAVKAQWNKAPFRLALATIVLLSAWVIEGGFHRFNLSESRFGLGISTVSYPVAFVSYFKKIGYHEPVFNDSGAGGYLEYQMPDQTWMGDSRFTDAPQTLEYFRAALLPASFFDFKQKYGFHCALLSVVRSSQLIKAILAQSDWYLAYADLTYAFVVDQSFRNQFPQMPQSVTFYVGEDLTDRLLGLAAIQWVDIAVSVHSTDLLQAILRQLAVAPRIPSFVLEFSLQYALKEKDQMLFSQIAQLRSRMLSLQPEDQRMVDRLLAQGGL